MDRIESYRDLCKEIELWEIRLWDLESEKRLLVKQMMSPPRVKLCASYSGMPGGTMIIDLPKAWGKAADIDQRIEECKDILSLKREAKRKMESVMQSIDALEYKVAYKRDIEHKPLYEIAKELGYTYDWIRKVSQRVKRMRQEKVPS